MEADWAEQKSEMESYTWTVHVTYRTTQGEDIASFMVGKLEDIPGLIQSGPFVRALIAIDIQPNESDEACMVSPDDVVSGWEIEEEEETDGDD